MQRFLECMRRCLRLLFEPTFGEQTKLRFPSGVSNCNGPETRPPEQRQSKGPSSTMAAAVHSASSTKISSHVGLPCSRAQPVIQWDVHPRTHEFNISPISPCQHVFLMPLPCQYRISWIITNPGWWLSPTPLKNDGVRHLSVGIMTFPILYMEK